MRIDVTKLPVSNKGMLVLTLTHKEQSLSWDVSVYDRVSFADIPTVFDCINDYWATLPKERQNSIWAMYVAIHETLRRGMDIYSLNQALQGLTAQLYSYMPYEEIRYWVNYKAGVKIPSNIMMEYSPSQSSRVMQRMKEEAEPDPDGPVVLPSASPADLNYPKELTYLRKDYQELAVLSVALRPMLPIWGEYISLTSDQVGGNFKEYEAYRLLYQTELSGVEPMERLLTYMEHSVASQPAARRTSHSAILGGLSMTNLPSWLLAGCVVRRVVFGQLHPEDDKSGIISNVFRYVDSTMKSIDGSFDGKVNAKKLPMEMNEEDNSSFADMYKVKQDVSDADLVAMNIYTEQVYDMSMRIDPTIPREYLETCLAFTESFKHEKIHPHQIILMQWVIHCAVPARGLPYLNKASIMRIMAVTQAALWHWGFFDLAALVTAIEQPRHTNSMQWGNESRSRIPKEIVDILVQKWPYYRRQRGKDKSVRRYNVVYRAVDAFCDLVTQCEWRLNAPGAIAEKVDSIGTARLLIISPDLWLTLAQFLIKTSGR